jgi:hypothetical protein
MFLLLEAQIESKEVFWMVTIMSLLKDKLQAELPPHLEKGKLTETKLSSQKTWIDYTTLMRTSLKMKSTKT